MFLEIRLNRTNYFTFNLTFMNLTAKNKYYYGSIIIFTLKVLTNQRYCRNSR